MVNINIFSILLAASSAFALPAPIGESSDIASRQSGGATCGSNSYTSTHISQAQNAGCNYNRNGQQVGSGNYPHRYNNYEGFDFTTSSPWYEFPILASHRVFDGSTSPGPDRVIFNGNCQFTGVITHTGASGNNFVSCDY